MKTQHNQMFFLKLAKQTWFIFVVQWKNSIAKFKEPIERRFIFKKNFNLQAFLSDTKRDISKIFQ